MSTVRFAQNWHQPHRCYFIGGSDARIIGEMMSPRRHCGTRRTGSARNYVTLCHCRTRTAALQHENARAELFPDRDRGHQELDNAV
jgi:hypothetical protein